MFECSILFYRYYVRLNSIGVESKSTKNSMTVPWAETALSTNLKKYELTDLINADGFELFFMSDIAFNLGSEKCSGRKKVFT